MNKGHGIAGPYGWPLGTELLPAGSIRPTRARGGGEQFLVSQRALELIVLALRRGDLEETRKLWREIVRQMRV